MPQCKSPGCISYALNIARKSGYCDVCYYKHLLENLLAVIHRDGGHYTELYGIEKSTEDAMKIVSKAVVK